MARAFSPISPDVMETAASGALVPIETMVSPMITDGILKILANPELPSTKKSAPLIKRIKPIMSNTYAIKILLLYAKKAYKKDFCVHK